MNKKKISFFIPHIGTGGVGKVFTTLASEFSRQGHTIEFVLATLTENEKLSIPDTVPSVVLKKDKLLTHRLRLFIKFFKYLNVLILPCILPIKLSKSQKYITSLTKYLTEKSPDILITAKPHTNITAILALSAAKSNTVLMISEHTALSVDIKTRLRKMRWRYILPAIQKLYPLADEVITVSKCVEHDLLSLMAPVNMNTRTIYNPINRSAIEKKINTAVISKYFENKDHVYMLAVGRLEEQKNFKNLLMAFEIVSKKVKAKLIIIGEGSERSDLETLAQNLGISQDLYMPGHVKNPYTYMKQCDLLVMSSNWEGLPTVLLEGLICGCNIVSTDCMCGPREILANGKYGMLVPVNNPKLLAEAMCEAIESPKLADDLDTHLMEFTPKNISSKYPIAI